MEYVDAVWIEDILNRLENVFKNTIAVYDGTVAQFLAEQKTGLTVMGRVFFHLVENKGEDMPFAFLATYSAESENGKVNHVPLKSALLEYKGQTEKLLELLSTVSRAAQKSAMISKMIDSGELFSPLRFSSGEAYTFLKETPLYEESGIICRIPDWWKKKQSRISVNINVGEKAESRVGRTAVLSFDPRIALGGELLTNDEAAQLLAQSEGLFFLKCKWVEIDHERLNQALAAIERAKVYAKDGVISMFDAMRLEMDASNTLGAASRDEIVEVTNGEWLKSAIEKLKKPERLKPISAGENFMAVLRGYQQAGVNWLNLMLEMGFGACLADDMGLGKTVQIIGLLEYLRVSQKQEAPSLLVIPASLIGNWGNELDRFAPALSYKTLHGKAEAEAEIRNDINLYITTYTTLGKLKPVLAAKWNLLILDEAQAIKNPGTKQAKAVKSVNASARIALTGTPIENRLTDLWSIFDFLNAGLLGSLKEFSGFSRRLREDGRDYGNLRAVVSPFILRRMKTDKAIISDLPDKIEMKTYTSLSKKQVVLYQKFVEGLEQKLYGSGGIERKGLILASLLRLKQICNHPDHYLGQSAYEESQSGKFMQLREICETIYEKRERVLVFTQFREIIGPLDEFLETVFERRGLTLHGDTPIKKRQGLVEEFCGKAYVPYMVLSLKAGGVGLNLAAANHVIHFDRWWNPAVENQATDRAFRIGQKKNVVVHKFVTSNTIEEKIDEMIEDKTRLSGDIIESSGESWITEMSDGELMALFRMAGSNHGIL